MKPLYRISPFLGKLKKSFLLLARHPFVGELRDEVLPNLRCFPVGSYAIYYRPCLTAEVAIDIIRVLHAARDIQSIFG